MDYGSPGTRDRAFSRETARAAGRGILQQADPLRSALWMEARSADVSMRWGGFNPPRAQAVGAGPAMTEGAISSEFLSKKLAISAGRIQHIGLFGPPKQPALRWHWTDARTRPAAPSSGGSRGRAMGCRRGRYAAGIAVTTNLPETGFTRAVSESKWDPHRPESMNWGLSQ